MRSIPALRFVAAALALAVAGGFAGCHAKISQPPTKFDAAGTAKTQGPQAATGDPPLYIGDSFSDVEQALSRKSADTDPPAPTF
ncbi:hypothetical protein [Variovorax guangxiensis]|uniref:hypothetical protein n=1 Tax=Variovorax guangxiensis TaxID=1775474 RepID=UPI002863A0C0|nr:hypothetical protein [Variovorax guangxiensis]MDR6858847.1 hypothetical protein [Variovorax guangxiensis]